MPLHPNNSTMVPPDAPRAAQGVPWEIAGLAGIGSSIAEDHDLIDLEVAAATEIEFFFASRAPASQWTAAQVQPRTAAYDITVQGSSARSSQQEPFSPLGLERMAEHAAAMDRPAASATGLRDIAGTPLTSPPGMLHAQWLVASNMSSPNELLSSGSGSFPVLRHVTPEFDSTHRVVRIPPPHDALATSLPGSAFATPQAQPALDGFQPDIAMPQHVPSLSQALDSAWAAQQPQLTTTTAVTGTPRSAPAILMLQHAPRPVMPSARGNAQPQSEPALESGHDSLTFHGVLSQLRDSAMAEVEFPPMPVLLRLPAARPQFQGSAQDGAADAAGGDDEAVQIVGNPDLAM